MRNKYISPNLNLYSAAEEVLMLSSDLPTPPGGGSGDGSIELPPIPMRADSYAPPAMSIEDAPVDILMGSNDGNDEGGMGNLLDSGVWGGSSNIEFPLMPMG